MEQKSTKTSDFNRVVGDAKTQASTAARKTMAHWSKRSATPSRLSRIRPPLSRSAWGGCSAACTGRSSCEERSAFAQPNALHFVLISAKWVANFAAIGG